MRAHSKHVLMFNGPRRTDEPVLERIVEEHLQGGNEVNEHIIHRLGVGDV